MHNFIINASLQVLPLSKGEKHPYVWVDEAIEIIKESKLPYEVGAFSTTVEGTYAQVQQLVNNINEYLYKQQCYEWILSVQMQMRSNADMTASEKTDKYRN